MKQKIMTGDRFILEAMQARKRLRDEVFNTALSTEELQALDLKANAHLFPELVNRDTDLRQRPMKEYERGQRSGRFVKKQKLEPGKVATNRWKPFSIQIYHLRKEIGRAS